MNMRITKRLLFGAVIAIVGCADQAGQQAEDAKAQAFEDFMLPTLDGGSWRLSDHRGKVVAINYWATWCPPCVEETPDLVQVAKKLPEVQFVGISIDYGNKPAVERFVKKYNVPYPIVMAKEGDPLTKKITGVPETFLIDKKGIVRDHVLGAISSEDLQNRLKPLLED